MEADEPPTRAIFEIEAAVSACKLGTDGESRGRPGRPEVGFMGIAPPRRSVLSHGGSGMGVG
jgi:hypothetical protein